MSDIIHPPADTDFVNEKLLIEQLNIPLKKIRALRPASVVERAGDGILWPLADARALATHLGIPFVEPEKTPADDTEDLTVFSTSRFPDGSHFKNPNIIQCRRKNGALVDVRVVHSKKYRPTLRNVTGQADNRPMVIRARPSAVGNWWQLVGREPAYPAQW